MRRSPSPSPRHHDLAALPPEGRAALRFTHTPRSRPNQPSRYAAKELNFDGSAVPEAAKDAPLVVGVRCSADTKVQGFFDALLGKPPGPEQPPMRGTGPSQKLKTAMPPELRPEYGRSTWAQDPAHMVDVVASTRTAQDLVGVPIDREALRATPKNRLDLVCRPGFEERAKAAVARAERLDRRDERQRREYNQRVADATRERMRRTREGHHARGHHADPVQSEHATMVATARLARMHAELDASTAEGAEELASGLASFAFDYQPPGTADDAQARALPPEVEAALRRQEEEEAALAAGPGGRGQQTVEIVGGAPARFEFG